MLLTSAILSFGGISYESQVTIEVRDQVNSSMKWKVEGVDGDVMWVSAIGVDSKDTPHIVYQDVKYFRIEHAEKIGGVWNLSAVHGAGSLSNLPLAIDSKDRLHIAFHHVINMYGYHGVRENGSWNFTAIIPGGKNFALNSIAVDPLDRPHGVAAGGPNVYHAFYNGDEWEIEKAVSGLGTSMYVEGSIAVDPKSRVHMAFLDHFEVTLTYALKEGGSWRTEFVDSEASPSSIAVTSTGEPHILYYGPSGCYCLRHAFKVGKSWQHEDLPFARGLGSITMDSLDRPQISFVSNSTLGYAFLNGTSWEWQLVDGTERAVGSSIALDSRDRPHIAYDTGSRRMLYYATPVDGKVSADIDVDPDTLNPRSRGRWITAYVELPLGYDPRDIDATTILLNDVLPPELNPRYGFVMSETSYIMDHDGDSVLERMVKFDRTLVEEILSPGLSVTVKIAGQLQDGTEFEGTDAIKVIDSSQLTQSRLMEAEKHETRESFSNTPDSRNVVSMCSSLSPRTESLLQYKKAMVFRRS
jgi:hypothetical protein